MGFNNGYDAGWQDAINAVKYGKVPGLGPVSDKTSTDTPAVTFDAGVLEGYDVEKLLSATDLNTYLAELTDAELVALIDSGNDLSGGWAGLLPLPDTAAKLGQIFSDVLSEANSRGLLG